jgi:lysyl endopeptidase
MPRILFAALIFTLPFLATAAAPPATQRVYETAIGAKHMPSQTFATTPPATVSWRAPALEPLDLVSMPAVPQEKSNAAITNRIGQPLKVGTNQPLAKAASIVKWIAVPGGFVAKIRASSQGAVGLRVRLDLGTVPGEFGLVAQGSESTRLEAMTIDPTLGNTHWTPWTEGASQVIELFSPMLPSPDAVSVGEVANFSDSMIQPKAAAAECTVPSPCSTGDAALDGAIAQRVKSNVKILFSNGGSQFLCTATLINSPLAPAPFLVTANHCINTSAEAATIASFWFYDPGSCTDLGAAPGLTQITGGTQLVFTNFNVDSTLVRMNQAAPSGAVFSGWSAAHVADGTSIVSVSHPEGDSSRIALGTVAEEFRVPDWPYDMYGITFTSGIIEGGSSGSGLFTLDNGSLNLRGVLTGSTVQNDPAGLSCTDLNEFGLYDRFEVFEPEIDQYISGNIRTDDAPNRVQDFTGVPITDKPLDQLSSPRVYPNMQINYAGDVDVYRFTLSTPATVHVFATGGLDTVGVLMDASGTEIDANDDETSASNDFGITHSLQPGTYFVGVGHWNPTGTGTYTLNLTTVSTSTPPTSTVNYTDLWWNSPANSESGWGLNLNHQGDIIFGTLFTYDASGNPLWLVLSNGAKQGDGSFSGQIYATTGDPFNANPWNPSNSHATSVGTMSLAFSDSSHGTLNYTYNGTTVTKQIIREVFSTPVTCTNTTADRSGSNNYQDLWWNPNESGWGLNVTEQGTIAFATLFDYDANGKPLWFVMPNGPQSSGGNFSGPLYTVKGPPFNANPWGVTTPTAVGTMTLHFTSGIAGTLTYSVNGVTVTKSIQRQTFSSPLPLCQ